MNQDTLSTINPRVETYLVQRDKNQEPFNTSWDTLDHHQISFSYFQSGIVIKTLLLLTLKWMEELKRWVLRVARYDFGSAKPITSFLACQKGEKFWLLWSGLQKGWRTKFACSGETFSNFYFFRSEKFKSTLFYCVLQLTWTDMYGYICVSTSFVCQMSIRIDLVYPKQVWVSPTSIFAWLS